MAYTSNAERKRVQTFGPSAEKARPATRNLDARQDKKLVLELPAAGVKHWGARSKAAVVLAVRNRVITLHEARERYAMSTAEFLSWEAAFDALGLEGLALTGRQMRRRDMTYCEKRPSRSRTRQGTIYPSYISRLPHRRGPATASQSSKVFRLESHQ